MALRGKKQVSLKENEDIELFLEISNNAGRYDIKELIENICSRELIIKEDKIRIFSEVEKVLVDRVCLLEEITIKLINHIVGGEDNGTAR